MKYNKLIDFLTLQSKKLDKSVEENAIKEACAELENAVNDFRDNGGTKESIRIKTLELINSLCEDLEV